MGDLWNGRWKGGGGAGRHGSEHRRVLLILFWGRGGGDGDLVVVWVNGWLGESGFAYGTLAVTRSGARLWGSRRRPLSPEVQAFLIIGVLGGFTTFSAFGMRIRLFRDYFAGSANVLLQVAIGLTAVVVRVGQALRAVW